MPEPDEVDDEELDDPLPQAASKSAAAAVPARIPEPLFVIVGFICPLKPPVFPIKPDPTRF